MGRQADLMAISERVQTPRYRFYLQNATMGLLEIMAPDGWNDSEYEISRDPEFWGITQVISFNDLKFMKSSRDFIRDVYESQGVNGLIFYTVYRLNDNTGSYEIYYTGKLDLGVYKIDQTGVSCQVIDTGFVQKVKTRKGQKVNVRQLNSVDGYEIPPFANEDMTLTIPNYNVIAHANWAKHSNMDSNLDHHYVPLWVGITDFTETENQSADIDPVVDGGAGAMFVNSSGDRNIHINGYISGVCYFTTFQPHVTFKIELYVSGIPVHTILTITGAGIINMPFNVNFYKYFTVLAGQNFWIQSTLDHSGLTVYDNDIHAEISEVQSLVYGTSPIALPYYEAFLRICQIITDGNDVFKSVKFGRTDSAVTTYDTDGQLGHITKGIYIRGSSSLNNTLSLSLQEMFKNLSGIFCLGMGIETIGGLQKVVIEDLRYFFSSSVAIDISDRIIEDVIGKEVIPDKHYAGVKSGYNTYEYLTIGGLAEFNTKMEFSTVISAVDSALDLVINYRGDTQGIVSLMKNTGGSEDVKGDDDIFIIDSIRKSSPYTGFIARTDEDFILVTGGADAENTYNLDLTPKRNLMRNGIKIRAGLQKNLGTYIRWQAGDKNTTLQTQRTGESSVLVENADVLVDDLDEPFYLPEYYTVECVLYPDELETIKSNAKGLIKLSATKYGWIWNLKRGNEKNEVTLKLLRANLNVVTPT